MQLIAGRTAQEYNQRKNRQGAFWEERYHATAIEQTSVPMMRIPETWKSNLKVPDRQVLDTRERCLTRSDNGESDTSSRDSELAFMS